MHDLVARLRRDHGLLVGWRANGTVGQTLAAIGLLLLLRYALAWVGIYLGLALRSPDLASVALAPIYPLTMISNVFVLPAQMPAWLGVIAEWNPLSATVTATRELFGNPGITTSTSWAAENATLLAIAWPVSAAPQLSDKDRAAPRFADHRPVFAYGEH